MKRFVCLLLVFVLCPLFAIAADGNSPFFGRWAGYEHHAIARYHTTLHHLEINKYGASYYFVFNLFEDKLDSVENYDGSWEIVDTHLRIPTSPITFIEVFYDPDTDTLYCEDPKCTYVRLP